MPNLAELFATRARPEPSPVHWPSTATGLEQPISLAYGFAAPELFPREDLVAATAAVLADDADGALNYGGPFAGLREVIKDRLRTRGVEAADEQVQMSYGSSQVLALLPQVFVDPGDVVLIEGPSFLGAVMHFADAGARIITIPVDAQGMDVDAVEQTLRDLRAQGVRAKFIYTIPNFQNPTGTTMPLDRRRRLVQLAEEFGVLVVEDDAYGDLRFEGEPLPSLASLDQADWVLYVGTFSKILAPGLRMGFAYGRPDILRRIEQFKADAETSPFQMRLVARFCADGRLDAHITELNAHYRQKRDVMLAAIAREFPAEVAFQVPQGGFFIWCRLPQGVSSTTLAERARKHGALFVTGPRCFANGQGDDAFRLAFSYQPMPQITEGIARIGTALRELM